MSQLLLELVNTYLLDETGHLLLDLLEPGLGVGRLGGVHLVDSLRLQVCCYSRHSTQYPVC